MKNGDNRIKPFPYPKKPYYRRKPYYLVEYPRFEVPMHDVPYLFPNLFPFATNEEKKRKKRRSFKLNKTAKPFVPKKPFVPRKKDEKKTAKPLVSKRSGRSRKKETKVETITRTSSAPPTSQDNSSLIYANNYDEVKKLVAKADKLYERKKYSEAISIYLDKSMAANQKGVTVVFPCFGQGDIPLKEFPRAQFRIGECYSKGLGVEKDIKLAVKYYTSAAESDFTRAQYKLGSCYFRGSGIRKNLDLAMAWLSKAASKGDDDAKLLLEAIPKSAEERRKIMIEEEKDTAWKFVKSFKEKFLCPITKERMKDPVIDPTTGESFEREAIEKWIISNNTSPLSRKVLILDDLIPNRNLLAILEMFEEVSYMYT